MDELVLRYLAGTASDLEGRRVERWREESDDNARAFAELRAVWEASEVSLVDVPDPPAAQSLMDAAEERRRRGRARADRRAMLRSPWMGYGLAAAAVAALVFVVTGPRGEPAPAGILSPVESSMGAGDVVTMSLSDGSVVRVAGATTLEFPPDPEERRVMLEGRAFFAVAEGDAPFVVRTPSGEVTVHGTRFEVRADGEGMRVVVVDGRVAVSAEGGAVSLGPGEVAYVDAGARPRAVSLQDVWELLDWEGGLLVFQGTPLVDVAAELSRHFGVAVTVADPVAGERRITAWFGDEPLDEVMSAVCLVAGTPCSVQGDSVVVGG